MPCPAPGRSCPSTRHAPQADDPAADVFFVHATTYDGGRNWNGPIGDAKSVRFLTRVILPNYAGPFARVGRMFAPRYRQASVYTELTLRDDALEARQFAYDDVRRAFDYFLAHFNQDRPLVVVGVEQGGTLVDRLMDEELAAHPELSHRLAAVYIIDATVLAAAHGPRSPLPACTKPGETALPDGLEPGVRVRFRRYPRRVRTLVGLEPQRRAGAGERAGDPVHEPAPGR